MAQRVFITSTPLAHLRPLSWQGVQAVACYDQFARLLSDRLSPAHLALLAEPLPDGQSLNTDWYAWLPEALNPEEAQPLSALPPETNARVQARLIALGRDIYQLAQELKTGADTNAQSAGRLLEMALTFPGEAHIFAVGEQPVLTAWGYAPDEQSAAPESLTRLRAAPGAAEPDTAPAKTAAAAPSPASGQSDKAAHNPAHGTPPPGAEKRLFPASFLWTALAFLLGALLAGFLLYLLRPDFSDFGGGCTRAAPPAMNATSPDERAQMRDPGQEYLREQGREEVLRAELERLRREYYIRLLECKPGESGPEEAPPPVTETPPLPEEPEAEDTAPPVPELAMPELPEYVEPEPPSQPKAVPEPKPEPPVQAKPRSDHLEIPDNPTDLSFLEGCWEAEIAQGTPGRYASTPQRLVYCFDANGNGSGVLSERRSGRSICVGGAEGELRGGTLRIKDKPPLRPRSCIAETITCQNASSGVAECSSVFEDGGTSRLVFRRK